MAFELDLQVAIYTALNNVVSVPVYDHVPQGTAYPYIVIGEDNFVDWSDDLTDGMEGTINLHTWHRPEGATGSRGKTKVKQIQGEIYSILHRADLDIGVYGSPGIAFEYSDCFLDSDGITYHGVQRFRVNFGVKSEFILGIC